MSESKFVLNQFHALFKPMDFRVQYQTRSQSFPVGVFVVLFGKRVLERAGGVDRD